LGSDWLIDWLTDCMAAWCAALPSETAENDLEHPLEIFVVGRGEISHMQVSLLVRCMKATENELQGSGMTISKKIEQGPQSN
jgi:hypothetical protein